MHLPGQHHHLVAQFFQSRRATPRSLRHGAKSGRTVTSFQAVGNHRAASFGSTAAVSVAGTTFAQLGTALPRRERTGLRAPAFFTAGLGAWRLRAAGLFPAGLGVARFGAPAFLPAGFWAGRFRTPVAIPAGLGILTRRPFGIAAGLVWGLGIRRAREAQGGEHR
jgi:hypothetical protein